MQVQPKHFEGTTSTGAGAAAVRKVAIPLPIDGAWTVTGEVIAIDPAPGRVASHNVTFNLDITGVSIAGTATETDAVGPTAWPMLPAGGWGAALVTAVLNAGSAVPPVVVPTLELEFTGNAAVADWAWELNLTTFTVP